MNMVLNGLTDLKKLLTMKKNDTALSSNGQDTGPSRRQFGFESRQRHQGKAKIPLNETNVRLFRDLKRNSHRARIFPLGFQLPPALNLGVFEICGSVICGLAVGREYTK